MNEEKYQPYGEEWKNELMKLPKIMIINLYRNVCLEKDELEGAYHEACNAAGRYEKECREMETELRHIYDKPI